MLRLVFSERNPLKSTVTDASTGQLVYDIKTPFKFGHHTTTIYDAQGQPVALYERALRVRKVTIRGSQLDFNTQFAPKKHTLSTTRTLAAPDGKRYEWKCHRSTWTLTDLQAGREVAKAERPGLRRSMKLDVQPEVFPVLDAIVLSFIAIESGLQHAQTAAATAG